MSVAVIVRVVALLAIRIQEECPQKSSFDERGLMFGLSAESWRR